MHLYQVTITYFYHVKKIESGIINSISGSFFSQSNIFARQGMYEKEMRDGMTIEQKEFYGDYFETYCMYLRAIPQTKSPHIMGDNKILDGIENALLSQHPKFVYKIEPWRYMFYYTLLRVMPIISVKDWIMKKFTGMPEYVPQNLRKNE